MNHISEEALEEYVMRALPPLEISSVEEHLSICSACRGRLQTMDEYVIAMRSAATEIRKTQRGAKKRSARR